MKTNTRMFLLRLLAILTLLAVSLPGVALAESPTPQASTQISGFEGTVGSYDSRPENQIVSVTRTYGPVTTTKPRAKTSQNEYGETSITTYYTKSGYWIDNYSNPFGQVASVKINWQVTYGRDNQTGLYSIVDEALMYDQWWNNPAQLPMMLVGLLGVAYPGGTQWDYRFASQLVWNLHYGVLIPGYSAGATADLGYTYNVYFYGYGHATAP